MIHCVGDQTREPLCENMSCLNHNTLPSPWPLWSAQNEKWRLVHLQSPSVPPVSPESQQFQLLTSSSESPLRLKENAKPQSKENKFYISNMQHHEVNLCIFLNGEKWELERGTGNKGSLNPSGWMFKPSSSVSDTTGKQINLLTSACMTTVQHRLSLLPSSFPYVAMIDGTSGLPFAVSFYSVSFMLLPLRKYQQAFPRCHSGHSLQHFPLKSDGSFQRHTPF